MDAQSGDNILSYGQKFPTVANPDRYQVYVIDETPLVDLEIAGHRAKAVPYLKHNPGALTVYYRRGGVLWTATSFDGKTWDKREVTEAAEWPIGGEVNCDLDKTDEIVIYRSANNELVELRRRIFTYGTFGSVENLTMYAQNGPNPNSAAPQDVGSYLTFDPVESNIYYYKTLDGLGIGVLFFGANGWTYQNISVKGGVDMLKPTVKWDDTWRRILYTNGTSGMLRALDPTTFAQQDIMELTGPQAQLPLTYVRDFVAGYSHLPNQQNAAPKNIYFSDWTDNRLYMLSWDAQANSYVRSDIRILGEGFSEYTFGNMQPNQQDLPTFYRTTDGRLRKLYYGPQAPIDYLMCNACWVNWPNCPLWGTAHVYPLQGNPGDETDKEPEIQQERD